MGERKRRVYDPEFKKEAVRLFLKKEKSAAEIANDLGISPWALYQWKDQYQRDSESAFPGKGHLKPEDAEMKRLQRENAILKEERDILKKALAIFSKPRE
jgi:transposase